MEFKDVRCEDCVFDYKCHRRWRIEFWNRIRKLFGAKKRINPAEHCEDIILWSTEDEER